MRKRLLLVIPLAVLSAALLYGLVAWGLNHDTPAPLSGKLTISDPKLAEGLHTFSTGPFEITLSGIGQAAPGGYQGARLYVTHQAAPGKWLWHTQPRHALAVEAK